MSRRHFLKASLQHTLTAASMTGAALALSARSELVQAASTRAATNRRRLVLIELAGANDGLNTLVPYTNDNYYRLRPTLAIPSQQVVTLNDSIGINTALAPLMPLWDSGDFAWIQGLGYPKPNRSHFKSMRLWETGSDGNRERSFGWLTHTMEHRQRISDAHGISLGGSMGLFASDSGRWISMGSTTQFEQAPSTPAVSTALSNPSLDAVTRNQQELHRALNSISARLANTPSLTAITDTVLGQQLTHVLRLISAGIDTPVYKVQLPGFDTHENQSGQHTALLTILANAVMLFRQQLVAMGEWNNTVIMTYSEFGRRASENRSFGTDHGTAAPHFVTGGHVRGGIYGSHPDLSALIDGDPAHTLDYRALYNIILSRWFFATDNPFRLHRDRAVSRLLV